MLNDINHQEITSDSSISKLNLITPNGITEGQTNQLIMNKVNKSLKKNITMQPSPSTNLKKTVSMGKVLKKHRKSTLIENLSTENIENISSSNNNLMSSIINSDKNIFKAQKLKAKKDNILIKKNIKLNNSTRRKNILSNEIDFDLNKNIFYIILFICIF